MTTLLITGANRGIGLEFVRQYAADGATIIAACRNPAQATELQALAKTHSALSIEKLDVADTGSIKALAEKLKDAAIDILINNAGILSGAGGQFAARDEDPSQTFGTIDADAWSKVFTVNTIAPMLIAQAFVPHLVRGRDKKIFNITSKMGSLANMEGGHIAYRSSKAALNAAMRASMPDLRAHNITIVNAHPGWVKTDMGSSAAPLSPTDSVTGMRRVIAGLTIKDSGKFLGYDGVIIPW